MTLPDLNDKIALFWEQRSFRTKAIIVISIGFILYIL